MSFSSIPIRQNGQEFDVSWVNDLRVQGASLQSGSLIIESQELSFSDFSAAATQSDVEAFALSNKLILSIILKHNTAFSGGSVTALTLDVGVTGELDRFFSGFDAFQAIGNDKFLAVNLTEPIFGGPTSIRVRANATGANLDQLTAGALTCYLVSANL